MGATDQIVHSGTVLRICGTQAEVKITQQSACADCHAKSFCAMADSKEKVVEVSLPPHLQVAEGQQVDVVLEGKLGFKAALFVYFFPFVLLMITLTVVYLLTGNEAVAGLSGLGILVPCYLALSLFKRKFKRTFEFTLQ